MISHTPQNSGLEFGPLNTAPPQLNMYVGTCSSVLTAFEAGNCKELLQM